MRSTLPGDWNSNYVIRHLPDIRSGAVALPFFIKRWTVAIERIHLSSPHEVLLTGRCANPVPCISHLVIVDFRQIVRGVEIENMDIEATDSAEQRIGCNNPVPLA